MISFLTSLKPFRGPTVAIQRRALRSWRQVHPDVEIIVYGPCPGIEPVAASLGLRHVPDIACGQSGPPLFNALAAHAAAEGRHDIQMYINGDILMHRCLAGALAVLRARFTRFLAVGQRVDLAEGVQLDPAAPDAGARLLALADEGRARLHGPAGKDYFVFPRGLWQNMPAPIVVGRGAYDCSLLAHCLRQRIPLVDCTAAIPALHLHHDSSHLPGGAAAVYHGPESDAMMLAYGVRRSAPHVADADWTLAAGRLRREPCRGDTLRRIELALRFRWGFVHGGLAVRALWRLRHPSARPPVRWTMGDLACHMAMNQS